MTNDNMFFHVFFRHSSFHSTVYSLHCTVNIIHFDSLEHIACIQYFTSGFITNFPLQNSSSIVVIPKFKQTHTRTHKHPPSTQANDEYTASCCLSFPFPAHPLLTFLRSPPISPSLRSCECV